jgi:hypothetical protein
LPVWAFIVHVLRTSVKEIRLDSIDIQDLTVYSYPELPNLLIVVKYVLKFIPKYLFSRDLENKSLIRMTVLKDFLKDKKLIYSDIVNVKIQNKCFYQTGLF